MVTIFGKVCSHRRVGSRGGPIVTARVHPLQRENSALPTTRLAQHSYPSLPLSRRWSVLRTRRVHRARAARPSSSEIHARSRWSCGRCVFQVRALEVGRNAQQAPGNVVADVSAEVAGSSSELMLTSPCGSVSSTISPSSPSVTKELDKGHEVRLSVVAGVWRPARPMIPVPVECSCPAR